MPAQPAGQTQLSVALVEPAPLLRELATQALAAHSNVSLQWTAAGAKEARDLFQDQSLDVLITELDLSDGNGIGLALSLRKADPTIGVVLVVDELASDNFSALEGLDLTGWRVVPRRELRGIEHLVEEVALAASGQISSHIFKASVNHDSDIDELTPRQREVLKALASGLANPGIADHLGIEVSSVVNHLTAIYNALKVPENANPRVFSTLKYLGLLTEQRVGQ